MDHRGSSSLDHELVDCIATTIFGKNSHAWPELWFDGIGWIPFEPTPQRAIPGAEDYTGVEAD